MAIDISLSASQMVLVENNLNIVRSILHTEIVTHESIFGFEYDDLYQEGCLWLCKAAVAFDPKKHTQFSTFAYKVIRNGLKTYCRLMSNKQKRVVCIPCITDSESEGLAMDQFPNAVSWDEILAELDITIMLERVKRQYKGSMRRGMDALQWKLQGYTGTQISKMYGVSPNTVGTWISRAVRKLKQNRMFLLWAEQYAALPSPKEK